MTTVQNNVYKTSDSYNTPMNLSFYIIKYPQQKHLWYNTCSNKMAT